MVVSICRQNIVPQDVKALVSIFERSHDMVCVEDVLHMVIRALSHKPLLASFLEQANLIGGCHVFVNLLQRFECCVLLRNSWFSFEVFSFCKVASDNSGKDGVSI